VDCLVRNYWNVNNTSVSRVVISIHVHPVLNKWTNIVNVVRSLNKWIVIRKTILITNSVVRRDAIRRRVAKYTNALKCVVNIRIILIYTSV